MGVATREGATGWGKGPRSGGANTLLRPVNEEEREPRRAASSNRGMPISSIYFNLRERDARHERGDGAPRRRPFCFPSLFWPARVVETFFLSMRL